MGLSECAQSGERVPFEYESDFGDAWLLQVLFEGRPPAEPGNQSPPCLEGERACPPEDVGGVWGDMDFLAALGDPENEQHVALREWIGRTFDPEAFNPAKATTRMRTGPAGW